MEYWISKQIGSRAFKTENTALAKAYYAHAMPDIRSNNKLAAAMPQKQ